MASSGTNGLALDQATRLQSETGGLPNGSIANSSKHDRLDGEYRFGKRRIPAPDMHKQCDFIRSQRIEQQWNLDHAGDGSNIKFGPGFTRGSGAGKSLIAARRDSVENRLEKKVKHDEKRCQLVRARENVRRVPLPSKSYLRTPAPSVTDSGWIDLSLSLADQWHCILTPNVGQHSQRNGFNVVTGAYDASKHRDAYRRRKFIDHGASKSQLHEGDRAMRDTALRFYRAIDGQARCSLGPARDDEGVQLHKTILAGEHQSADGDRQEAPGAKRALARARLLALDGLPNAPRRSGILGLGRGELPSYGVSDNFAHSLYDKSQRPPSPQGIRAVDLAPEATALALASTQTGGRARAGSDAAGHSSEARDRAGARASARLLVGDPSSDPFARTLEARFQATRLPRGQKAPNRVIGDEGGAAMIAPAVKDPEKAMIRLDREIRKKVGPRPASRPRSLLARAAQLRFQREIHVRQAEVAAVSALS